MKDKKIGRRSGRTPCLLICPPASGEGMKEFCSINGMGCSHCEPVCSFRQYDMKEYPMTLNEFQNECERYSEPYFDDIEHCAIVLGEEAGEVLGKVKKWGRDSGYAKDARLFKDIHKELGDLQWCVARMSMCCGWSLQSICEGVLAKLEDRRRRGVLHGEGDDR